MHQSASDSRTTYLPYSFRVMATEDSEIVNTRFKRGRKSCDVWSYFNDDADNLKKAEKSLGHRKSREIRSNAHHVIKDINIEALRDIAEEEALTAEENDLLEGEYNLLESNSGDER